MIFKKALVSFLVLVTLLLPLVGGVALATSHGTGIGEPVEDPYLLKNPLKGDVKTLTGLLNLIMDAAMLILVPIIVLAIIWVGFMFVKARGNETEITNAKKAFMYVMIGSAIILGAKVILTIVESTINSLKP